jgi:Tol biopolymer transport system component/predicted Ser/Thr protein kinase
MPEIGQTISHYRILEKIGVGGMGEVYLAEDLSLDRKVALKFLPDVFTGDPERMARFEREAKLLASLNHPNIAAIYGLEKADGIRFLVLEYVEGETLQKRVDKGPLPIEEALAVCRQITEGLEAAHESGVIHRDLKPANVMITGQEVVKILDFGLAKALADEIQSVESSHSPTITEAMTQPGVVLGTAAYMSPEQAKGKTVDKCADIWAFGSILYECLTGKQAFRGNNITEILAKVLETEPDWSRLPAHTPASLRTVLRQCLQKDPKLRLHDIADARILMGETAVMEAVSAKRPSFFWLTAVTAVALIACILIGVALIRHFQPAPPTPVVTATIKVEPGYWLNGMILYHGRPNTTAMAISSDGTFIIYSAIEENPGPWAPPQLYLRRMDQSEAKSIMGTEGGISPFLSPDDRWIGFWADGKLKKVPVEGGVATTLCDDPAPFGASWSRDNGIAFVRGSLSGIASVSAEGGTPEILTNPDPKREEYAHRLPAWLPNGNALLFTIMGKAFDPHPSVALLRPDTRDWTVLLQDAADARYVSTGHIVFLRRGILMAVRFDPATLEVIGQPVALVENVMQAFPGNAAYYTCAGQFGISDTGSLLYAAGGIPHEDKNLLVWVDQKGTEQPVTNLQFPFSAARLSPDGQRIAYFAQRGGYHIWVYDLSRGTNSLVTAEEEALWPIWSPDGKRLLFASQKTPVANLFWQPYDGSSSMERLIESEYPQLPSSWSSDGKSVALVEARPDTGFDIAILDVDSGKLTPFLNSQFSEAYPEFSPDGRWMAYTSNESTRGEVYVRQFPGPGMKYQISNEGGSAPLWARDGKQLFYRCGTQVWVVDVETDGGFSTSKPRLLFEKSGYSAGAGLRAWDLSLDGQQFLMVRVEQREPTPVTEMILIQNWFEELKERVPTE